MRILIATGIFPPQVGGPATYAASLRDEFVRVGHEVRIATYGWEKKLPTGLRHAVYLLRSLRSIFWSQKILVLDTFSVGIPIALATRVVRRPYVIRIGGDFLWEQYIETRRTPIPLPDFYTAPGVAFSLKERLIFKLTGYVIRRAGMLVFTTEWLKDIWQKPYALSGIKTDVIENVIERRDKRIADGKVFLWAGREIFLKNIPLLRHAFDEAKEQNHDISLQCLHVPKQELEDRIASSYAVIIPSISEVSPNLALEAIAHCKPFILTKHNGLARDILELGILVDPLSQADIARAISALSDDETYANFLNRNKAFHRTRSWGEVAGEYIRALSAIHIYYETQRP